MRALRSYLSLDSLVLLLLEQVVELTRLVDRVALEVGHAEAELPPRRPAVLTRLQRVVQRGEALLLVHVHVGVLEQVAQRHTRCGYGGEARAEDDGERALVRGPEVDELIALALDDLNHCG
jgi:hypothetical protein